MVPVAGHGTLRHLLLQETIVRLLNGATKHLGNRDITTNQLDGKMTFTMVKYLLGIKKTLSGLY